MTYSFLRRSRLPILRARRTAVWALAALLLAGTAVARSNLQDQPAAEVPTEYPADPGLREVVEAFSTDYSSLRRFYPIAGSENRTRRLQAFLENWREALEAMDYAALDQPARIDFLLLRNHIQHEHRTLYHEQRKLDEVRPLIPFADQLIALEEARARMEPIDARQSAATLAEMKKQVDELRRQTESAVNERNRRRGRGGDGDREGDGGGGGGGTTRPTTGPAGGSTTQSSGPIELSVGEDGQEIEVSPTMALRAAEQVAELQDALRHWNDYYAQFHPEFAWWAAEPYAQTSRSLDEYAKLLRERVAGVRGQEDDPLIGDPIGRQALMDDLQGEMLDYAPEELLEIARRELAWCHEQRVKAAREMGLGDDWQAAVEKVKSEFVGPGEQDDLVRDQAREAIAFVDDRELVTVPELCRETWQLEMIDSRRQRTWPFASYGGQSMNVAYATEDMDHDRKLQAMRGNNIAFTRIVTPHELIPGHHLQGFMAQRYRPWRRIFSTPFYGEGWALHWELLLWDLDYPRTPEERIGMLVWRSHRAARIIVSLAYHLGEMTPQEMVDFLVDNVGFERDGATSEVRRFIGDMYSPLYQCGYMIGGLQLRQLYRDLVENGEMTPREFHDTVLKQNSIPNVMVRAAILEQPLEDKQVPEWRFYGEVAAE